VGTKKVKNDSMVLHPESMCVDLLTLLVLISIATNLALILGLLCTYP
jgi:hypothetical protein